MRNVVDLRHLLVILFAGSLTLDSASASDVPQSFTLDGQLFSDAAGTTPLVDSAIGFKVQILDQGQLCVLYEEQQTLNTSSSQGYFSAQVGSAVGSPRRTVGDSANTMASIFQNINAVSGKLLSNGAACTAAALAGNRRFVRIVISPPSMGGADRVLSPNLTLDSVPNAVVAERAESIQGFRSSDLLKVNTAAGATLSQTNLESLFSSVSRFNSLTAVVDGTSTNYVRSTAGGARLPVLTGAPTGPTEGAIWYDTTDDRLKYYDGSAPISVGSGSGSVTSVGFTAPSELTVSGAPVTTSGTIAVTWASQTANRVLASPSGSAGAPSFRVLVASDVPFAVQNLGATPSLQSGLDAAKGAAGTAGRVWIATDTRFIYRDTGTVWETIGDGGGGGGPTGTAGGDLNGTYPNPTVDGIHGVAISAVAPVDGQVLRYTSTGTQWAAANFSAADLRTAGGAAQFASATCTAAQTTTWSSLTNTFTCIDIAGLAGSVITSGTVDIARLPAAVQYWTAATGGINYAGGRVGIGTTTPSTPLHVYSTGGNPAVFEINNGNTLTFNSTGGIQEHFFGSPRYELAADSQGYNATLDYAGLFIGSNGVGMSGITAGGSTLNGTQPVLYFYTNNSFTTPKMAIDATGNVGIGTTSPTAGSKLYVNLGNNGQVAISANDNTAGYMDLSFIDQTSGNEKWVAGVYSDSYTTVALQNAFYIGQTTSKSESVLNATRFLINDAGNVGIGNAAPQANSRLQVNGTATSAPNIIATGAAVNLSLSNIHYLKAVGGSAIALSNIADGASYTIMIADTTQRTYTFTGCTNSYFSPANSDTVDRTTYSIMTVVDGANTECFISWVTGYAP